MKRTLNRILCCCGNGVGTSLMMQITMEEALESLGIFGVEVEFGTLFGVTEDRADLFVVSEEVADTMGNLPVIGLEDLMDVEEATEKLKLFLGIE